MRNQLFQWEFSIAQESTCYPRQNNNFFSTTNGVFVSLVRPFGKKPASCSTIGFQINWFHQQFNWTWFWFCQHPQAFFKNSWKEFANCEFMHGVSSGSIDLLTSNATKYLMFFDCFCRKFRNSIFFVDADATQRRRGWGTMFIKLDLKQTILGRWAPKYTLCLLQMWPWYGAS